MTSEPDPKRQLGYAYIPATDNEKSKGNTPLHEATNSNNHDFLASVSKDFSNS